jgi:hypothetical protein
VVVTTGNEEFLLFAQFRHCCLLVIPEQGLRIGSIFVLTLFIFYVKRAFGLLLLF